jgi:hypothetical protein
MKKAVEQRLAAAEQAIMREAEARRSKAASETFWATMRALGDKCGVDLVGPAFSRHRVVSPGMDDRPPARNIKERVQRIIEEARAFIDKHRATEAVEETAVVAVGDQAAIKPKWKSPRPTGVTHAVQGDPPTDARPAASVETPERQSAADFTVRARSVAREFSSGSGRFMGVECGAQ